MHHDLTIYLGLILIIIMLVMAAQRLKISYPIVLVVGGLALSLVPGMPKIETDPEIIFLVFLPPLLYEAAWHTSWKDFWRWRRVITSFAFLIVILTSCIVAYASYLMIPGFTLALGFLLGGIISPPDAVSASAILKDVEVPKRTVAIIEGESLLNDASSLIVFRFALAAVLSGQFIFQEAATSFVIVILMGVATGLAVALVFYAIHRWMPTTPTIDTVLTFITPYVMYLAAEEFHFSGVLAVVSGGLFMSYRSHEIFNHLARIQTENVWAAITFALNSIVFMLIGLELPVIVQELGSVSLSSAITYALVISFVIMLSRLIFALGASVFTVWVSRFITTADSRPGWKAPVLLGWAGMRGVVSLASALSIPLLLNDGTAFPQRNLILFITFVVILVTIVFQGLTLPFLARWLNIEEPDYTIPEDRQHAMVRRKLSLAALTMLDGDARTLSTRNKLIRNLRMSYENDRDVFTVEDEEREYHPTESTEFQDFHHLNLNILEHQRNILRKISKKNEFSDEVIRKQHARLDLEEEKLRQMMP